MPLSSSPVLTSTLWPVLLLLTTAAPAAPGRVTARGGDRDLAETPVVVEVAAKLASGDYVLTAEGSDKDLPANVFEDGGKTYLAAILDSVRAGHSTPYTLRPAPAGAGAARGVRLLGEASGNVAAEIDGAGFFTMVVGEAGKPYYYPILGPGGAPFTRAYPMKQVAGEDRDHPHQRSMWFTHGSVNGVDFWASDPLNPPRPNYGTIRQTARATLVSGAAVGLIRTADDWLGPDGKTVCQDERVVRVYATRRWRLLDFDVTVRATAGPVAFGDTKEGMFGLRVASSMDVKNKAGGKITNAEGTTDDAAWGKASPWVDYTGPVAGKPAGIAVLNHPTSFRYPTTWHVRTYGLFAANPFGWHDFGLKKSGAYTIPAGESIRFRYRVIFHDGTAPIARLFEAYAQPPELDLAAE